MKMISIVLLIKKSPAFKSEAMVLSCVNEYINRIYDCEEVTVEIEIISRPDHKVYILHTIAVVRDRR